MGNKTDSQFTNIDSLFLFHRQLAAITNIGSVINFCSAGDVVLRLRGEPRAERSGVSDGEVEGVGTSSTYERDDEDSVSGLGNVESRGESDHRRACVRIPNHRDEESRLNLIHREAKPRGDALRELRVGLVEDGPLIILGSGTRGFHQMRGSFGDVLE